jgi:hypothetical protein
MVEVREADVRTECEEGGEKVPPFSSLLGAMLVDPPMVRTDQRTELLISQH